MITVGIAETKKFFFDERLIESSVDKAHVRNLSKLGAFIRADARASMKKARQMALGEMTEAQRKAYETRVKEWKVRRVGVRPRRPLASSRPGEPPRVITGLVKKFTFFTYDPNSKSVVVGPARLNTPTSAPETLEHGGTAQVGKTKRTVKIAARPFMGPAAEKNEGKVEGLYADSIV